MDAYVEAAGPLGMADQDVCIAVGEDLQRRYPDYPWMVGCNQEAGTVVIDLAVEKPPGLERYGFLLHLETVLGAGGQQAVMRAGGEILERFGLQRGAARDGFQDRAAENGLDVANVVSKSRF